MENDKRQTSKKTFTVGRELNFRYRISLKPQIEGMINFQDKKAKESRSRVMHALECLEKATSEQICHFLLRETEENNRIYEQEDESKRFANEFFLTDKPIITAPERLGAIELRTIQRRLKELKEEGLVKRLKGDLYILIEKARSDIRYFPEGFRDLALSNLKHIKNTKSHEGTMNELVKGFGTYVVYCFIEAIKPTVSGDSKLSLQWLKDALSPFNMYMSFLSALDLGEEKHRKPSPDFYNGFIEVLSYALQRKYPSQYEYLLKSKTNCLKLKPNSRTQKK